MVKMEIVWENIVCMNSILSSLTPVKDSFYLRAKEIGLLGLEMKCKIIIYEDCKSNSATINSKTELLKIRMVIFNDDLYLVMFEVHLENNMLNYL